MVQTHKFGSDQDKKSSKSTAQSKPNEVNDSSKTPKDEAANVPSDVNKDVWANAETAWRNMSGGRGVSDPKAKEEQIRKHYDQMVESDKQTKAWEGTN